MAVNRLEIAETGVGVRQRTLAPKKDSMHRVGTRHLWLVGSSLHFHEVRLVVLWTYKCTSAITSDLSRLAV